MHIDKKVQSLLDEVGAVLIRHNNHPVYRIPGAQSLLVLGGTCSDHRAINNQLARIRRLVRQRKDNNAIRTDG